MHKRFVNHCTIELNLIPDGPILIKSGKEGADPTKPDMEFVETYHQGGRTVYLPGSSLKGAIRAHAERIVRTVGKDKNPSDPDVLWAGNPLDDKHREDNPNLYLEDWKSKQKKKDLKDRHPYPGAELYKLSCFVSQLFGSTSVASRLRIEDAYPVDPKQLKLEERNGVAIDRVFGSVAVGPFNYQVCTGGAFRTKIHLKNFTLAQLGLIGLVLRDLNDGWFGIGFAKSRGLGTVQVELSSAVVQYPGCELRDGKISVIGSQQQWTHNHWLLGVREFLSDKDSDSYGFTNQGLPKEDRKEISVEAKPMTYNFGLQMRWANDEVADVTELFTKAVESWSSRLPRRVA
ncbi:MAG: RAMP superfamily CRISPR-associated protein [Leptolyngbyaceae cyanobacterium bins.302]|nr:RAMP superfamily CRISPR-associated protein [Leptolyngbyaceae cyanobacterium bins.302]